MTRPSTIDRNIVGELIIEELPEWQAGICHLTYDGTHIVIRGENDHLVERVPASIEVDAPTRGDLGDIEILDLLEIVKEVNNAIKREYSEL